jgi:pimeloyl-ACP methyl ester carboxylesterase
VLPGTENLSPDIRTAIGVLQARPRQIKTALAEGQGRLESNAVLGTATPLGDKPLLVLASAQNIEHLPYWKEAQQIMTGLSSNSRLIVVPSGHAIHFEQPRLVAESVREVVTAARTGQPLNP